MSFLVVTFRNSKNWHRKQIPFNCSSHGILEHFKLDFVNLVEHSVSVNTWNVYANAEKSFEKFRKHYDLEKVWPVPISHLINFIVYLAKNSCSPNTAKSYIAAIGFKMKMYNLTDSTDSFIVKQLLKGMSKTYKRADIRRPITVEILADIIRILPHICNSTYEVKPFSAVFCPCIPCLFNNWRNC